MSEKSSAVASQKCKVEDEDDEEIKQTKEREKILSEANTKKPHFRQI